eukprot:3140055-Prymnesium_polylepis.1
MGSDERYQRFRMMRCSAAHLMRGGAKRAVEQLRSRGVPPTPTPALRAGRPRLFATDAPACVARGGRTRLLAAAAPQAEGVSRHRLSRRLWRLRPPYAPRLRPLRCACRAPGRRPHPSR